MHESVSVLLRASQDVRADFVFDRGSGVVEGTLYHKGAPLASLQASGAGPVEGRGLRGTVDLRPADDNTIPAIGEGGLPPPTAYTTGTDEDGHFRFEHLRAGTYCLEAAISQMDQRRFEEGTVREQVSLARGQGVCVDLHLGQPGAARLYGQVSGDNDPLQRMWMKLLTFRADGVQVYHTEKQGMVDTEGNYAFDNLAPGFYIVRLHTEQYRYDKVVELNEGEERRVDMPPADATGRIEGLAQGPGKGVSISLRPTEDSNGLFDSEKVRAPGRFAFSGLPPGEYRLTGMCRTPGGKSRTLTLIVQVYANQTTRQDVVFDVGSASLTAGLTTPRDEQSGAWLFHENEVWTAFETDEQNVLVFEGLPPGHYEIQAVSGLHVCCRDIEIVADEDVHLEIPFETGTATLRGHIESGNRWQWQAFLRTPGHPPIRPVTYRSAAMKPVPGAAALVERGAGSYEITDLTPGRYEFTVLGYTWTIPFRSKVLSYDVTLEEGQTVELDINLLD